MNGLSNFRETRHPRRPPRRRAFSPAVEGLDQRALLSAGLGHALAGQVAEVRHERDSEHNGTVVKTPTFYEDYVGPRLAQLDVVKATGTLLRDGSFHFVGVTQGVINPNVRATYVFGVDRNGHLPTGPFPGRPNIRFDATIAIKIVPGQSPTVTRDGPDEQDEHDRARLRPPDLRQENRRGDRGESAPLNGPCSVALQVRFLARGRASRFDQHRQLRTRVP